MNLYETLKESMNLKYDLVGIKLVYKHQKNVNIDEKFIESNKLQRYCEYLKRASQGEFLKLKKGDFSCVTAEIFLGFKKPENIKIDNRLEIENLDYVLLFPISKYDMKEPDSIILIVNPKNCMDIIEAYIKIYNKPLNMSFETFRGICSEVTAYVIKQQDINFSFLCSGSRIFAGFDDCELVCGIPASMAQKITDEIVKIIQDREADMELMKQLKEYQ